MSLWIQFSRKIDVFLNTCGGRSIHFRTRRTTRNSPYPSTETTRKSVGTRNSRRFGRAPPAREGKCMKWDLGWPWLLSGGTSRMWSGEETPETGKVVVSLRWEDAELCTTEAARDERALWRKDLRRCSRACRGPAVGDLTAHEAGWTAARESCAEQFPECTQGWEMPSLGAPDRSHSSSAAEPVLG